MPPTYRTPEHIRLEQARTGDVPWKGWGPYLAERQWGTVREDTSASGDAWNAFPHDQARSRTYRWGEDGIAGICDDRQRLCLALALWNGADPILKERMFGLTNGEGNHGEDVKEYWFFTDATPTHSYLRCVYKYPQRPFPYADIVETNAACGRDALEYELLDTGVFDDDRYFDVEIEYAKADHDDICMQVTVQNRGPDPATLHLLPTLWFRNTWSWTPGAAVPELAAAPAGAAILAHHAELGPWRLDVADDATLLFCDNATNPDRAPADASVTVFPKDAIGRAVVDDDPSAVNPGHVGTKAAAWHVLEIAGGGTATVRVRLHADLTAPADLADGFAAVLAARRTEADAFYETVMPAGLGEDAARVMRQALAGLVWGKQYYEYDVHHWLAERGVTPWNAHRADDRVRNTDWVHLVARDVISMPDVWEYPWFAAWDLAFHTAPLSLVDVDFAKAQVELLVSTRYAHPNGQIPAYEWNFSDVNPPVTAWAALWVYEREAEIRGAGDREFLARVFARLLANFTWWVNRKDPEGRNLFAGGFLGLDNIGVFDRSSPIPGGGSLEQADGTAWMALYCQWMLQMAVELAHHDAAYADMAMKFVAHFAWISLALNPPDHEGGLWDDEDGFYYDVLRMPDGTTVPLRVRSLVGLLPICAATVIDHTITDRYPGVIDGIREFRDDFAEYVPSLYLPGPNPDGDRLLALVSEDRLRRILAVMLDEDEFLGPHGIRSLSRRHLADPYEFDWDGVAYRVGYLPAESDSGLFGGNSNWRGPVWFPMNVVILRALLQLHKYYGDRLTVEFPTGSGCLMDLREVALALAARLTSTFTDDADGRRPVFGGTDRFQTDPHWHDLIPFHEYFHGDNGAGLGASHQTGWTGLVALLFGLDRTNSDPAGPV